MKVEIKKGNKIVSTTEAAYSNFFKSNGWKLVKNLQPKLAKNETKEEEPVADNEWDEVIEEEANEIQKPLSEMNRNELIELANSLGVDVSNLNKNAQLREAIKAVM